MSPTADLFRAGLERLTDGDLDGYLELCSDDVEYEFPFAPPGRPREVRGQEALRSYMEAVLALVAFEEITGLQIYETDAHDTIVVEMGARGHLRDDGRPYVMRYIAVVRSAGDRIVAYRDYWNPLALGEYLGAV